MIGFRSLFLQDLGCVLTSKPLQYGSAPQLQTALSCRRFWSFFQFPKTEETLSTIEKAPRDRRIPLPPAPREPASTLTDSNVRRLPSMSFGFDANPAVYRSTCKFHKSFAKRKVEETSLLDGNPVPRNLKLKLQGYKMLESELEAFEMAHLGEGRSTEDVFEVRGDSKITENSIQSRSATMEAKEAKEAKRDAGEASCEENSLKLAQRAKLAGESQDAAPWDSEAPRATSAPPPCCPAAEPQRPSRTPPSSHPDKPSCPPSCPRASTTLCQSAEESSVVLPGASVVKVTSAPVCQGAGPRANCASPSSSSPCSLPVPLEKQLTSLAVYLHAELPKSMESMESMESTCSFSPATPATPATPAAPTSCSGSCRIASASETMPSLRLKESRTSLNSMSSGRSVSGLSSAGPVGLQTNSDGQSALPRTARSLPGLAKHSQRVSGGCTSKSQSSCSAGSKCPRSKPKNKKDSCKKGQDPCERTSCFEDANDSACSTNKPGCRKSKRGRKSSRECCSAAAKKPPKRRSKCRSTECPGRSTDETCSTKKPQCPARKKSSKRRKSSCAKERDTCKRSSRKSPKRCAESPNKRSACSLKRPTCSKETQKKSACKDYVCPGNVTPESCSTNKPQCPRRKKKSASKKKRSSCATKRTKCPGRRGSRSFCTHLPRRLSLTLPLTRSYGNESKDTFVKKFPKPGPKCKKSSGKESCQESTATLKKCEGKSRRTKDDDVQVVKDQLAKEREEVKICKKGSKTRTSKSCGTEKGLKVEKDGSSGRAGKPVAGMERVISPCKLKRSGVCKDMESSSRGAKEKGKGKGKGCGTSASRLKCVLQYAPTQLLQTVSHADLVRKYSGTCSSHEWSHKGLVWKGDPMIVDR